MARWLECECLLSHQRKAVAGKTVAQRQDSVETHVTHVVLEIVKSTGGLQLHAVLGYWWKAAPSPAFREILSVRL